jgi:ornithine cyclodeaminase
LADTLLLRRADVSDLLDMRQAIKLTEAVYREQAGGWVQPWPPFVVGPETHELRINAGSISGLKLAGLRAGMKGGSQVLLYDTNAGQLICIASYPFSYLRVGATVGLAVDRLARPEARRLLVIGTGRIALVSLEAISCLRSFERIQVYSRQGTNRLNFCSTVKARFGLDAEPTEDVEAAVRTADVVLVATSASRPVLQGAWLPDRVHVCTAGIRCEIDQEAYLRAELVVVSSQEQEERFIAGPGIDNVLQRLTREGRLDWRHIAELGQIVAGHRQRPAGITVFRESQGGFGDLILASWIYERAKALGRGRSVDFNA